MFPTLDEKTLKHFARLAIEAPEQKIQFQRFLSHPLAVKLTLETEKTFVDCLIQKDKKPLFDKNLVQRIIAKHTSRLQASNPAMFQAINDYAMILNDPTIARVLLTRLSNELTKEILIAGKLPEFKKASDQYAYQVIGPYRYPIPFENYRKINKDALLTKLLLKILQTADMGHRSTKWFGYVPEHAANDSIKRGDLFVESQFGIGSLHGKYSHMIQWVMLIYAVELGYITLPKDITPKSIIQTLVTVKTDGNSMYLWQTVNDTLMTFYSFGDPYRLTSLLSTGCLGDDCATLEVYLRDSFCDSFLQWVHAHQMRSGIQTSPRDFAKMLSFDDIHAFNSTDYLSAASLARHEEKLKKEGSYHTSNIRFFSTVYGETVSTVIEKSHRPSQI